MKSPWIDGRHTLPTAKSDLDGTKMMTVDALVNGRIVAPDRGT